MMLLLGGRINCLSIHCDVCTSVYSSLTSKRTLFVIRQRHAQTLSLVRVCIQGREVRAILPPKCKRVFVSVTFVGYW